MTISEGFGDEMYTLCDEESEFEVESLEILNPDLAIQQKVTKPTFSRFCKSMFKKRSIKTLTS